MALQTAMRMDASEERGELWDQIIPFYTKAPCRLGQFSERATLAKVM